MASPRRFANNVPPPPDLGSRAMGRRSFLPEQQVCYRQLRKYLKPSTRGGITRTEEVANEDSTTRIVTEPSEVLNLILKRDHAHFSQTTGTPFTTPPLSTWLGKCGETEIGQDILNG